MNDFQRVKSDSFVTISNTFLKDKNLSNKAKGVLAMILALPDNWDFSIKGMVAITKDGEASLRSAINEMKENGYCAMKPVRINNKIARWKYLFSGDKLTESLLCDFLQVENLNVENRAQYNINNEYNDSSINTPIIDNKNKKSTNVDKKDEAEEQFLIYMKEHYPYIMRMDKPMTRKEASKLKELYGEEIVTDVFDAMNNCRQLIKKYRSAYQTANNWCTRRIQNIPKSNEQRD